MSKENIEKVRKQFIIVKSLVLNEDGKLLFVKRDKEDLKQAHGKWEFPGGIVDFGESPEQTAIRETKEESGYEVGIIFLLPKILSEKWIMPEKESHMVLICYVCKLVSGKISLKDHGVSEVKWFGLDEVPKDEDCLPGIIDFVEIYRKVMNKKK